MNEKSSKKKKFDKFSQMVEKEIPNYFKYFKEEIEKTIPEIYNLESKSNFFAYEYKYEELVLPDSYNLSIRNPSMGFNYLNNFEKISNRNFFFNEKGVIENNRLEIHNTENINKISKIIKNTDITSEPNEIDKFNIRENAQILDWNKKNSNEDWKNLNITNKMNINNKFDIKKNLVYVNNIKSKNFHKPIGFDIHIKDADDSAFEKLIID